MSVMADRFFLTDKAMDSKAFADYIDSMTNAGYACTLLSLGYELGLFELMIGENRPMRSHEIADKAQMKERYIREWLAGVVTAQVVTYDAQTNSYSIPTAHHATLGAPVVRSGGVVAIGARKEAVKRCFVKDGPNGLTYDHDDTWWAWFGNWRRATSRAYVQEDIFPYLKKCEFALNLESGLAVLDACCGSGDLTFNFANLFPNSTFCGVDISSKPLKLANERAISSGLNNLKFSKADVQNLPNEMCESFDVAMILDSLHDLPCPVKVLSELHKVLKPGGYCICTDFLPGSKLQDDIGDLRTAAHYAISVHNCTPFKLCLDPNIERDNTWGRDEMELAVKSVFHLEHKFEISKHILMLISKKI